jgi:2-methylisocitrate lyase-like PEP mutase family enzyme
MAEQSNALRRLQTGPSPLVLPKACDGASARSAQARAA